MRDQYAGDLSDLLKFSLLRALALNDRTIGVGWYYNAKRDRVQDGRHREYCDELKWTSLDRTVWNALRDLPERSVSALERLSIWPIDTKFHRAAVDSTGDRTAWVHEMTTALRSASIVFLDPDNGIGKATEQHATMAEIAALRGSGRAVVLIRFPSRSEKHEQQIESYHSSLLTHAGAITVTTLRTCVSVAVLNKHGDKQSVPRVRWFTLIDADPLLIERAEEFAGKLRRIEKCTADVVHGIKSMTTPPEKAQAAVLQLMGVLERALRAITPDQSAPFHKQVEAHATKFSDTAGIVDARRVRNAVAHGETVSDARAQEAQAVLKQALAEISSHCPDRMRAAIREALPTPTAISPKNRTIEDAIIPAAPQAAVIQTTTNDQNSKVANLCPECGHQFKGHGFDGIDAHWRARHEAVMPYKQAWPLIKSGNYRRLPR